MWQRNGCSLFPDELPFTFASWRVGTFPAARAFPFLEFTIKGGTSCALRSKLDYSP